MLFVYSPTSMTIIATLVRVLIAAVAVAATAAAAAATSHLPPSFPTMVVKPFQSMTLLALSCTLLCTLLLSLLPLPRVATVAIIHAFVEVLHLTHYYHGHHCRPFILLRIHWWRLLLFKQLDNCTCNWSTLLIFVQWILCFVRPQRTTCPPQGDVNITYLSRTQKSYNQNWLYQEISTRSGSNLDLRVPINFYSYTCNNVY